ncbi:ABC transporter permease [Chryseobacterium sp. A321]
MASTAYYIAKRYLIAKKGSTAVTFITWLAAFAMMTAVASMFIIVSVFTGLEDLNKALISDLHADITISSSSEKQLKDPVLITKLLEKQKEVEAYSKLIEEKVYLNYGGVGEIAYLRAVDSNYTKVNPIDKRIFFGKLPDLRKGNEVILENNLDNRLAIPVGETLKPAFIYMPKPGVGLINSEADIFEKQEIIATGVFPGNDQLDNYIIAPISLAQSLLGTSNESAYKIVAKLHDPTRASSVKAALKKQMGSEYQINTKNEENAAFWKMINTEKLMIYLIFSLVILITTFNLAGAIIILQLDKKRQAMSLISLGFPRAHLRKIYFYTGVLIVVIGILLGLAIGTILCVIQMQTGLFKAGIELPFPVRITLENYFIVAGVALVFGLLVSWLFSKIKKDPFPAD